MSRALRSECSLDSFASLKEMASWHDTNMLRFLHELSTNLPSWAVRFCPYSWSLLIGGRPIA